MSRSVLKSLPGGSDPGDEEAAQSEKAMSGPPRSLHAPATIKKRTVWIVCVKGAQTQFRHAAAS